MLFISSNISSWYDKALVNFTSIGVDLATSAPMTLCQDVVMQVGSMYVLTYQAFLPMYCQNMYIWTYLNQVLLTHLYIANASSYGRQIFYFFADRSANTLCFNDTHDASAGYPYYSFQGGFIDNISLILVNVAINFVYQMDELEKTFLLKGNHTYHDDLKSEIYRKYNIIIQDSYVNYLIESSGTGYIQIRILQLSSFRTDTIQFAQRQGFNYLANRTQVNVSVSWTQIHRYFFNLEQNQISIVKKFKTLLILLTQLTTKIGDISEAFFITYFINMIIDMQFLSLLYVFTQISIIPDFTAKIYHKVLSIIFLSESFAEYLSKLLSIQPIQIHLQDRFVERIEKQKRNLQWFGLYGVTSRVIQGSISDILVLGLSMLKFVLLKLVFRIITLFFPRKSKVKIRISELFLCQFCFIVPFVLIPLQANIINSVDSSIQKSYKIFCVVFVCGCLLSLCMYMFSQSLIYKRKRSERITNKKKLQKNIKDSHNKNKKLDKDQNDNKKTVSMKIILKIYNKKQNQQSRKPKEYKKTDKNIIKIKNINRNTNTNKTLFCQQAFIIPLLFFTPLVAFLGNAKVFLIVNTLTVFIRFFNFQKKWKYKILMVVDFVIGLVWIIHHSIFILFIFYQNKDLNEIQMKMIANLGIAAVLTVTSLIMLQILKLSIKIILIIKKYFRYLLKFYHKKIDTQYKDKQKNNENKLETIYINVTQNKNNPQNKKIQKIIKKVKSANKTHKKIKRQKITQAQQLQIKKDINLTYS